MIERRMFGRTDHRSSVTLFGGAENLFDAKYFENGFRAPGFVARGGVNFRFR